MKLKARLLFGLLGLLAVGAEGYGRAAANHNAFAVLTLASSSTGCEFCGGPDPASVLPKFYNTASEQPVVPAKN